MSEPITEDFVSFETAITLKEKKFDIPVKNYYSIYTESTKYNLQKKYGAKKNWNSFDLTISRPSQSLVMKWLRERGWFICIIPLAFHCGERASKFGYNIWAGDNLEVDEFITPALDTYEEACEYGIMYCIENLI